MYIHAIDEIQTSKQDREDEKRQPFHANGTYCPIPNVFTLNYYSFSVFLS